MKAEDSKLFGQFFEGNKRQYIIPVYQRNYDWTLEQCNVLFTDIINSFKLDKEHFIGSIVQVQKDEEYGVKPFIVIDGQQRLTTIYLLLAALIDYEENTERKEILEESLFNIFKGDKPKISEDKFKLKLKANTKDNINLIKLMSGKLDEVEKSSNVIINYNFFKSLIKEAIGNNLTAKDIKKGIEKLVCVTISLDEKKGDNPQLVFERINSTGLPLELDDLVRNYVLMAEINQEYLFEEYWSKIESLVPKEYRTSFLVDFLQTMTSAQINENSSYDNFKKWAINKNKEEILNILLRFAKYFSYFIGSSTGDIDVDRILSDMLKIDQGSLYTFLFSVFEDHFHFKSIDKLTLRNILELLLSYGVRRIVCEVQSKSQKGLYRGLYRRAFDNQKDKLNNYYEILASFMLNQLTGTLDEFPDDNKFRDYLKNTKMYRNKKITRYLLETLENSDSKEKIDTKAIGISIEHIMPQNYYNIDWRNSLGSEFEETYKNYLDTLGNLTLTGYNSSLSDNAFLVKKEKLLSAQTKIKFLNKEFYENNKWSKEEILIRATRLAQKTISLFQYPKINVQLYHFKVTNDTFVIDLENGEDPTNTVPVSFEFNGERNIVKSYQEILKMTLNSLFKINRSKITELSLIDFPMGLSKRNNNPYITTLTKQNLLRRPSQIEKTDICFETNLSSMKVLEFINDILKFCNIDSTSFVVYCQKNKESSFV
jgi:uncharacterized protein with ParB-like and HNH nuclease domain